MPTRGLILKLTIFGVLVLFFTSACNITTSGGDPTQAVSNPTLEPTSIAVQPTTEGQPTSAPPQPTQPGLPTSAPPATIPPTFTPIFTNTPTNTPQPTNTPATIDTGSLPTHTPGSGGAEPEIATTVSAPLPITSSDGCRPVEIAGGSAMGAQVFSAQSERSLSIQQRQTAPLTAPRSVPIPVAPPIASEAIIQFTPESTQAEREAFIASIGAAPVRALERINAYVIQLPEGFSIPEIPPSPIVVSIEAEQVAAVSQAGTAPNDPRFGEQWYMPVIGLPTAWGSVTASTEQITVAVIDSGICANHPDLVGRLVPGYDFVENDTDPQDEFGHGCGVAGVIASTSGNGQGIAGVAPNVQIMPLRVLNSSGLGGYSVIAEAIIYAVDNGADIINLSLAGPSSSFLLEDAIAYAVESGVVVIAAAGNNGTQGAWYPAAYPSVIAVGSVEKDLSQSSFSNFGDDIDVLAPGRDILTTSTNGDYQLMTGTSFAAPLVSGIAALALALDVPLNTEDQIVFLYTPETLPSCGG
jgi:thermitase